VTLSANIVTFSPFATPDGVICLIRVSNIAGGQHSSSCYTTPTISL